MTTYVNKNAVPNRSVARPGSGAGAPLRSSQKSLLGPGAPNDRSVSQTDEARPACRVNLAGPQPELRTRFSTLPARDRPPRGDLLLLICQPEVFRNGIVVEELDSSQ